MWYLSMETTPADDLEGIREKLEVLQSLLKFQPWARVVEIIANQIVGRERAATKPIDSIGGALVQNYEKGIITGLRLAISLPKTIVDNLQEEFNAKLEEERKNVSEQ